MHPSRVSLIAGLGNPGLRYSDTRHNAGFWFLDRLQSAERLEFGTVERFKSQTAVWMHDGRQIRVMAPCVFMNRSGQSVAPMARYYRISPEQILVIHDELDLPPGTVRLKCGGGTGGHNGLNDISASLGSRDFIRLRIGIGHPGDAGQVTGYVLSRPPLQERACIGESIDRCLAEISRIVSGDLAGAMQALHTRNAEG